jgi:hypothetical protein
MARANDANQRERVRAHTSVSISASISSACFFVARGMVVCTATVAGE